MDKLPFSIYDFFGYLVSGFVVMAAVDYGFRDGHSLTQTTTVSLGVFWIVVAYIAGHVVANVSGFLYERNLVGRLLGTPEENLFDDRPRTRWRRVFPGYFDPLPEETRQRVLEKARAKGVTGPGRALFIHCHATVKKIPVVKERLDTFLNLYGFCRNTSLACLIGAALLLLGDAWNGAASAGKLWWSLAAIGGATVLLYRYLKFYRHYGWEVFVSYAEDEA